MRCITNYIKFTVSLVTIVFAVFIFSGANLAYESLQNTIGETQEVEEINIVEQETIKINTDEEIEEKLKKNNNLKEEIWQVEIPSIGLIAPIAEGTSQDVMKEYVGHFESTSLWKGNIGLAAHNRRISNKLF